MVFQKFSFIYMQNRFLSERKYFCSLLNFRIITDIQDDEPEPEPESEVIISQQTRKISENEDENVRPSFNQFLS